MDIKAPEKKQRMLAALELGMVMLHLDARRPGVLVPTEIRGETHLRLNVSYRFDPPDLTVNDWGVRCTLSFSGQRFNVAVPWSALFAITSHVTKEFWWYPDDMPPEVMQRGVAQKASVPVPNPRPMPVLAEAPPAPSAEESESEQTETEDSESEQPEHEDSESEVPAHAAPASVAAAPEPVPEESSAAATPSELEEEPKPRRSHLRLVK